MYHDNKRKIIEAFRNHKYLDLTDGDGNSRKLNLWTNGETLFSYGMALVSHNNKPEAIESEGEYHWYYKTKDEAPSVTTSRHMSFVEAQLGRHS